MSRAHTTTVRTKLTSSAGAQSESVGSAAAISVLTLARGIPLWQAAQARRDWAPLRGKDVQPDIPGQTAVIVGMGERTTPMAVEQLAAMFLGEEVRLFRISAVVMGLVGVLIGIAVFAVRRKRRIAAGAGVHIQEVNRLLNQFEQMQGMMKKMKGGGLMKMMKRMGGGAFPR